MEINRLSKKLLLSSSSLSEMVEYVPSSSPLSTTEEIQYRLKQKTSNSNEEGEEDSKPESKENGFAKDDGEKSLSRF